MQSREQKTIRQLFRKLVASKPRVFPGRGGKLEAPEKQGVYVIYDPRGKVLHVGSTPRAAGGIRQRLANHLHNASSFSIQYLKRNGDELRMRHSYRCLPEANQRRRALLEAYAIGCLCPAHIGLGLRSMSKPN